jgi:hypothetical protein
MLKFEQPTNFNYAQNMVTWPLKSMFTKHTEHFGIYKSVQNDNQQSISYIQMSASAMFNLMLVVVVRQVQQSAGRVT